MKILKHIYAAMVLHDHLSGYCDIIKLVLVYFCFVFVFKIKDEEEHIHQHLQNDLIIKYIGSCNIVYNDLPHQPCRYGIIFYKNRTYITSSYIFMPTQTYVQTHTQ